MGKYTRIVRPIPATEAAGNPNTSILKYAPEIRALARDGKFVITRY